jgi:hypothetical protein
MPLSKSGLEQTARRAAKRVKLVATKSRWRAGTVNSFGHFMLIDPYTNRIVAGQRSDMTAEEVIKRCKPSELSLCNAAALCPSAMLFTRPNAALHG